MLLDAKKQKPQGRKNIYSIQSDEALSISASSTRSTELLVARLDLAVGQGAGIRLATKDLKNEVRIGFRGPRGQKMRGFGVVLNGV